MENVHSTLELIVIEKFRSECVCWSGLISSLV